MTSAFAIFAAHSLPCRPPAGRAGQAGRPDATSGLRGLRLRLAPPQKSAYKKANA